MNEIDLPKDEMDRIFRDEILPQVIGGVLPQEKKEAFILGGQPGSGKSALASKILRLNSNTVFINGDDLRPYHPKYYFYLKENDKEAADRTQRVCNLWVEQLIRECIARDLNIMVEGTMRTKEVPLSTARMLQENKYSVNLVAISAPAELSLLSLDYRYNELKRLGGLARYTKKESHDEAFGNIENTLKELSGSGLFERFYIYSRNAHDFEENIFEKHQIEEMLRVFRDGRTRTIEDKEKDLFRFRNLETINQSFPIK